jgi:hypothetical protein
MMRLGHKRQGILAACVRSLLFIVHSSSSYIDRLCEQVLDIVKQFRNRSASRDLLSSYHLFTVINYT